MKEFPEDQAERMIPPLMMESRYGMEAFLMATTKGDEPAPAAPEVRRASSEGQITPIASTEPKS